MQPVKLKKFSSDSPLIEKVKHPLGQVNWLEKKKISCIEEVEDKEMEQSMLMKKLSESFHLNDEEVEEGRYEKNSVLNNSNIKEELEDSEE